MVCGGGGGAAPAASREGAHAHLTVQSPHYIAIKQILVTTLFLLTRLFPTHQVAVSVNAGIVFTFHFSKNANFHVSLSGQKLGTGDLA